MRLASWNTRGLGNKSRGGMVGSLVYRLQIQFMATQETMVKEVSQTTLNAIWKHHSFDAVQSGSNGRSGGLLSIWRTDYFSLIQSWVRRNWIATILRYLPNNAIVLIINVYAPQQEDKIKFVWSQLTNIARNWPGPLCILGDFNSVSSPDERLREVIDLNSIDSFNNFILSANLFDQHLSNDDFTWEGPLGKFSRIDRILVNLKWVQAWSDAIMISASPNSSDHKPIIWGKKLEDWGPKPFRFNNSWLSKPGFLKLCESYWHNYPVFGWTAFVMGKKLRLLKADLKVWNLSNFDQETVALKNCVSDIKRLKDYFKQRDLNDNELNELANLKKSKKLLMTRIDTKRRHQSRYLWLRLGDKNSKFFHAVSRISQQSSHISGLYFNDLWQEDPQVVKEFAINHFENLFSIQNSLSDLMPID
ncbi:uncharacterized protein [Rutidosis leptorrhynchoides]|uniref:uncharacterized protein n=1 Tax=Rutidosis leptorrhynchoides TaxID=125765 RepID=UPI003A98EF3A